LYAVVTGTSTSIDFSIVFIEHLLLELTSLERAPVPGS
jgi:hypothetical protein